MQGKGSLLRDPEHAMRTALCLALASAGLALAGCSTPNTWSTVAVDVYLVEDEQRAGLIRFEDPESVRLRSKELHKVRDTATTRYTRLPREYLYRHPEPVLTQRDIAEAEVITVGVKELRELRPLAEVTKEIEEGTVGRRAETRRIPGLSLTFTPAGRRRLADAIAARARTVDVALPTPGGAVLRSREIRPRLAVKVEGQLLAVFAVKGDLARRVALLGDFDREQAEVLAKAINGEGPPPDDLHAFTSAGRERAVEDAPQEGVPFEW
jgi:hypothetical protein